MISQSGKTDEQFVLMARESLDVIKANLAQIGKAARQLQMENDELDKSAEIVRSGLKEVASLMDQGRIQDARELIASFLIGVE